MVRTLMGGHPGQQIYIICLPDKGKQNPSLFPLAGDWQGTVADGDVLRVIINLS